MTRYLYKNKEISESFLFDNEFVLKNIYLHILDECNLNCAYCDNFSPLVDSNNKYVMNPNNLEKTFKRLKHLTKHIPFISIGGGEPLLHPDLLKILQILRNIYNKSIITLQTNGILLYNKQFYNPVFIKQLSDLDIDVRVTLYPISKTHEKILLSLKEYYSTLNARLCLHYRERMVHLKISTHKQLQKTNNFYNCDLAGYIDNEKDTLRCNQINENGDLFFCTLFANIRILENYFNIKFDVKDGLDGDYVNIFDIDDINKLIYPLNNRCPFCDYCIDTSYKRKEPWKLSKRKKYEWISEN